MHWYRNVFSHVPAGKLREVALMLKAIHAQEDRAAARRKADEVIGSLKAIRLSKAAEIVERGIDETLAYFVLAARLIIEDAITTPVARPPAPATATAIGLAA